MNNKYLIIVQLFLKSEKINIHPFQLSREALSLLEDSLVNNSNWYIWPEPNEDLPLICALPRV